MIRSKLRLTCLTLALALATLPTQAADYGYTLRGSGGPEERFEGVISRKTAGGLMLLSFARLPNSLDLGDSARVHVRFWLPEDAEAYLTVQEIHQQKSYQLDATRSQWPANENEFSWPIKDVIAPMGIDLQNLGVVISERRYGGSGIIFPASLSTGEAPPQKNAYQLTIRSKYTCTPLTWTLSRIEGAGETPERSEAIDNLPSERPRSITLDMEGLPEGWYRLRMKCDRKGHGSGSGIESVSRRTYTFFHRQREP